MATFDGAIAKVIENDPELADEVRELVRAMIKETKVLLRSGTPTMKAALLSKGMAAVIQSVADQDKGSELQALKDQVEAMRQAFTSFASEAK